MAISAPSDSIISDFIFTDVRAPTIGKLTSRAQVGHAPEERLATNPKGAVQNEPRVGIGRNVLKIGFAEPLAAGQAWWRLLLWKISSAVIYPGPSVRCPVTADRATGNPGCRRRADKRTESVAHPAALAAVHCDLLAVLR